MKPGFDRIPRLDFNRLAVEHNLPLFWRADANLDGSLQPNELAINGIAIRYVPSCISAKTSW